MTLTKTESEMYDQLQVEFPFCMCCGIPKNASLYTMDYSRWLENAHILGGTGQRKTDRRNLLRLCKLCHDLTHGHTIKDKNKNQFPNLTRKNLLWVKQRQDPEHFDIKYLDSIGIQNMPTPEEPPAWFLAEFELWQPELYRKQTVEQFKGKR